ncbi:MAG: ROK family protein [Candidatus Obscuribacterales bacterium]
MGKDKRVLTIDIGGSSTKMLVSGHRKLVKIPTGKKFSPQRLMDGIEQLPGDWEYDCVSVGFPGRVSRQGRILVEPLNLGKGWVDFDFDKEFRRPTKVVNDAVLQAVGSYGGGRMLYLGLGTGVGSAFIVHYHVIDFELGALLYTSQMLAGDVITKEKLRTIGKPEWNRRVKKLARAMRDAFLVDYVVLGGGNAEHLKNLPKRVVRGDNKLAFKGGQRLWAPTKEGEEFVLHTSHVVS